MIFMTCSKIQFFLRKNIIFFLFCLFPSIAFTQGATTPTSSPVYTFLERHEALDLLSRPLPTHRPLTRKEIASFLKEIDESKVSKSDLYHMKEYFREYHFEINESFAFDNSERSSWLRKLPFRWFPKSIYESQNDLYHFEENKFAIRFNPRIRFDVSQSQTKTLDKQQRSGLGWSIQSQWENIGFSFRYLDHFDKVPAVNAFTLREWRTFGTTYPLFQSESESYITRNPPNPNKSRTSEEYIVSTTAITYQWKKLNFLLGRETVGWGPGNRNKLTLGKHISPIDQVRLDVEFLSNLRFVYLHGWIQSKPSLKDTLYSAGDAQLRMVDRQKYIAAHRLEWIPVKQLTLGISEAVIYADRAPELPYLIPINLFFATEHNRGDNDNKSIAFDVSWRVSKGMNLYAGLWVDDLTIDKIGTGYVQNKFANLYGLTLVDPFTLPQMRWNVEYAKMNPFAGSHFFQINRYEHWGKPLGLDLFPNSDQLSMQFDWEPYFRWQIGFESAVTRHVETSKIGNAVLSSGDINSHYPMENYQSNLYFGNGQGKQYHDIQAHIQYEMFENFHLILQWRQHRWGAFDSQNSNLLTTTEYRRYLPGLFDLDKKTYPNSHSQVLFSVLFNIAR